MKEETYLRVFDEICREAHVGEIYDAIVVRMEKYGAFVELFKGQDALLHVSKLRHERVDKPEDVLKVGDVVKVKVTEIDDKGKVNVSAKDLLPKPEKKEESKEETKSETTEEKKEEKHSGEVRFFGKRKRY